MKKPFVIIWISTRIRLDGECRTDITITKGGKTKTYWKASSQTIGRLLVVARKRPRTYLRVS